MAADIARFFGHWGGLPWRWGTVDCCAVLAAWAMERGHGDLLEPFRGRYESREGCESIIEGYGSLAALIGRQASRIGLAPASEPAVGVMAVIGSPKRGLRQWGAIYDGSRWQVRACEGFMPMSAPILCMWRV